ncbi:MAG: hypothetical protein WBC21_01195 [Minisyncoccales bacterium]
MEKLSKKLIVYLDQNFISEMAKVETNKKVSSQFKDIYELLHEGFIDEKIVVPSSWFHEIETSLSTILKKKIMEYQGYLGQIDMNFPTDIRRFQLVKAVKEFLGEKEAEPTSYGFVFRNNPDQRTRMFDIKIDTQLERFNYRSERVSTAKDLDKLRKSIEENKINYKEQLQKELNAQIDFLKQQENYTFRWLFKNNPEKVDMFLKSNYFKEMPTVSIYSQMWSKLLTSYKNRQIKSSDMTDIDIISTYLPYIEVLATDLFMANLVKELELDKIYQTTIFSSKNESLKDFKIYLKNYLINTKAINIPKSSIFVLSDDIIKEHSFELFHDLGMMSGNISHSKEWVDIYGFDDGNMPEYQLKKGPKRPWPFYGLQDVHIIKIKPKIPLLEIIKICKEKCRSEKFILLNSYRKLPSNFVETLIKYCDSKKDRILNYKIYSRKV